MIQIVCFLESLICASIEFFMVGSSFRPQLKRKLYLDIITQGLRLRRPSLSARGATHASPAELKAIPLFQLAMHVMKVQRSRDVVD